MILPSIKDESIFLCDGDRESYLFLHKNDMLVKCLMVQDAEHLHQFSLPIKFGFFLSSMSAEKMLFNLNI